VFGELTSAQVDELKKMDEDNLVDEEELYLPDVDDEGRNNGYSIIPESGSVAFGADEGLQVSTSF
jgi:hypothetical protein